MGMDGEGVEGPGVVAAQGRRQAVLYVFDMFVRTAKSV